MPSSSTIHSNGSFLLRAQYIFAILGGLYVLAVILLTIPFIQTHVLYLHAVRYPFFTKYDTPETYGLAPDKTINLNITTFDNITIGAWFILSDTYYHSKNSPLLSSEDRLSRISSALTAHPTIMFFHGNAATRAAPFRVDFYKAASARLHVNVLAVDYRGFGDSEGFPSENGLANDARAAWDWAISNGAKAEDIILAGHSLGTAVTARLGADLSRGNVHPRGVVLLSAFSSIRTLLDTYNVLGFFPLMKPLAMIPGAPAFVTRSLIHRFDTLSIIKEIKAPIILAHAENDWEIPVDHSEVLFEALLDPLLPPLPELPASASSWTKDDWNKFHTQRSARGASRAGLVENRHINNFGSVEEFSRSRISADALEGRVVLVRTLVGGHDGIVGLEGVQDIIGKSLRIQL